MVMWKLKSCPRCRGDIFIDKELDGWHEQCLQCGYVRNIPNTVNVHQHSGDKGRKELSKLSSRYP